MYKFLHLLDAGFNIRLYIVMLGPLLVILSEAKSCLRQIRRGENLIPTFMVNSANLKEILRLLLRMTAKVCNLKAIAAIFILLIGTQLVWAEAEVEAPHQLATKMGESAYHSGGQESMTISTLNEESQPFELENAPEANPGNVPHEIKTSKVNIDHKKVKTTFIEKYLFLLKDTINRTKKSLFEHKEAKGPAGLHMLIINVLIFAAVGLVLYTTFSFLPRAANPTKKRLEQLRFGSSTSTLKKSPSQERRKETHFLKEKLSALGHLLIPKGERARLKMKMELARAGYRRKDAISLYSGIKVLLALLFMGSFVMVGYTMKMKHSHLMLFGIIVAGLGMYLPILWVKLKTRKRKITILSGFPDALDLLAVCVDAGLGLDAAIVRVSEEMYLANRALSEEFQLLNLEIRAGKPRPEALHNLGQRTAIEDVQSMVAMLIQTEKFGTSISHSLRVHSDASRTKRKLKAEEAAAKTTVKMVFPLMLFILPALFVIVMGPAVLQIINSFTSK